MSIINKFVTEIINKYCLPKTDIQVDNYESWVFEPEELQDVSENPEVALESRMVTTFPVVIEGKAKFAHVIAEKDNYRILDIVITE